jgi:4-carboxymuconolactone decarboxylase
VAVAASYPAAHTRAKPSPGRWHGHHPDVLDAGRAAVKNSASRTRRFAPTRNCSMHPGSHDDERKAVMKKKASRKRSRDYDERFERGMRVLKRMGRENLMLNQKALYPDLYEMSVGHLFGDVWGRPGLSLRERQLVTLAANIALARPSGNHSHYLSSMHLGITKQEICEVMIQVGHYAGWPTLSNAVRQFTEILEEQKKMKQNPRYRSKLL